MLARWLAVPTPHLDAPHRSPRAAPRCCLGALPSPRRAAVPACARVELPPSRHTTAAMRWSMERLVVGELGMARDLVSLSAHAHFIALDCNWACRLSLDPRFSIYTAHASPGAKCSGYALMAPWQRGHWWAGGVCWPGRPEAVVLTCPSGSSATNGVRACVFLVTEKKTCIKIRNLERYELRREPPRA